MNPEIKAFTTIGVVEQEEKRTFEQQGLRELCSNIQLVLVKRGGREPGVHQWGG